MIRTGRCGHSCACAIATRQTAPANASEWRLALGKTRVLDGRPLINSGNDQHSGGENRRRAFHSRGQQRGSFESPLRAGGSERKGCPGGKISGGEAARRCKRLSPRL